MEQSIYDNRILLYWTVDDHGKLAVKVTGRDVRSANSVGVVVTRTTGPYRTLIPWHMVISLTYHTRDEQIKEGIDA